MSGLRFILVPWHPCNGLAQGLLPSAIRQQSCRLPQSHDPPGPALDCFLERSPRNPVVSGKSDQLLNVAIVRPRARRNMEGSKGCPEAMLPSENKASTQSSLDQSRRYLSDNLSLSLNQQRRFVVITRSSYLLWMTRFALHVWLTAFSRSSGSESQQLDRLWLLPWQVPPRF